MNFRWKAALIGLAASVTTLLAGTAAPVHATENDIVIGALLSLTGPLAGDGKEQQWAYEQAIADVNKKGGLTINGQKRMVKLVTADDGSTEAKVNAAMENLINTQKADILLSTHSGQPNVAAAIVAEKYKKFYMITGCFPFEWQPHKFKYSALFFFHPGPGAEVPFQIWAKLPPEQRPKNPALIMEDSPDGKGFGAAFIGAAKKHNYKFAVADPWQTKSQDYKALITKMKEANVRVPYFHGWKGTWTGEFHDVLGDDSDYILTDGFWSEQFAYPGAKDLGDRHQADFKKDSVTVGAFYANAQILMQAVERANSLDAEAISKAIRGQEFKGTLVGDMKFDDTGFALIPSVGTQWWKGKHELIFPDGKWAYKPAPASWDKK